MFRIKTAFPFRVVVSGRADPHHGLLSWVDCKLEGMRRHIAFSLCLTAALAVCVACGGASADRREYTLQGQILSVTSDHKEATIKHEDIKGFMPAMTMP